MSALSKYGPIAVAILGVVTPFLLPSVSSFWAGHGNAAIVVGSLWSALAAFAPQPHK